MLIKKEDEGEERGQTAFLADPYAKSAKQPKEEDAGEAPAEWQTQLGH